MTKYRPTLMDFDAAFCIKWGFCQLIGFRGLCWVRRARRPWTIIIQAKHTLHNPAKNPVGSPINYIWDARYRIFEQFGMWQNMGNYRSWSPRYNPTIPQILSGKSWEVVGLIWSLPSPLANTGFWYCVIRVLERLASGSTDGFWVAFYCNIHYIRRSRLLYTGYPIGWRTKNHDFFRPKFANTDQIS